MNKIGMAVLGLAVLAAQGQALACDDQARTAAAEPAVVEEAIARVRQEQREQIARSARVALAQLRSETASALAQGATATGNTAVKAAP